MSNKWVKVTDNFNLLRYVRRYEINLHVYRLFTIKSVYLFIYFFNYKSLLKIDYLYIRPTFCGISKYLFLVKKKNKHR